MIGVISSYYSRQQQAAFSQMALSQNASQLQQAGLGQMIQVGLGYGRAKSREEKILDMEFDLSNYLSRSKDLQNR